MGRDEDFSIGPYDLAAPPDWARDFPDSTLRSIPRRRMSLYWVAPFLPEIELRVLLYLIRRTLGFKKQGDQITVEQIASGIITREGVRLDWGAQLGERSVQRALSGLETKGLIERHRQLDPERGWRPSYIRLRLCDQSGQDWQQRGRQTAQPGVVSDTRGRRETPAKRTAGHQAGVLRVAHQVPEGTRPARHLQEQASTNKHSTRNRHSHPSARNRKRDNCGPPSSSSGEAIANEKLASPAPS